MHRFSRVPTWDAGASLMERTNLDGMTTGFHTFLGADERPATPGTSTNMHNKPTFASKLRQKNPGYSLVENVVECLREQEMKRRGGGQLKAEQETKVSRLTTLQHYVRLDTWSRISYNLFCTAVAVIFVVESTLRLHHIENNTISAWLPFDIAVLLIFLLDLFLGFVTPIHDLAICDWRCDISTIVDAHMHSLLCILDLSACVPIEILAAFISDSDTYLTVYSTLRAIRSFPKLIKTQYYVNVDTSFPGATTASNQSRVNALTIANFVFWGVVPLHLFTVFTLGLCTWESGPDLSYLQALYWVVYTITSVGYGDVSLPHTYQLVWAVVLMLVGTVVIGMIIGWLGVYIQKQDQVKSDIHKGLTDMASLLDHYRVSSGVRNEILSFHTHYLENYAYERHEKSVLMLPATMRDKIKIHIRMKLIQMVPMFQLLPYECQTALASVLDQEIIDPYTSVMDPSVEPIEMFFLGHGMVEVDYGNDMKKLVKKGQFFGEISLLWEQFPCASARTVTYSDLLILHKDDFIVIAIRFPEFEAAILAETDADADSPELGLTVLSKLRSIDLVGDSTLASEDDAPRSFSCRSCVDHEVAKVLRLDKERGDDDQDESESEPLVRMRKERSVVFDEREDARVGSMSQQRCSDAHYIALCKKFDEQAENVSRLEKLVLALCDNIPRNDAAQDRTANFQVFGDKKKERDRSRNDLKKKKGLAPGATAANESAMSLNHLRGQRASMGSPLPL